MDCRRWLLTLLRGIPPEPEGSTSDSSSLDKPSIRETQSLTRVTRRFRASSYPTSPNEPRDKQRQSQPRRHTYPEIKTYRRRSPSLFITTRQGRRNSASKAAMEKLAESLRHKITDSPNAGASYWFSFADINRIVKESDTRAILKEWNPHWKENELKNMKDWIQDFAPRLFALLFYHAYERRQIVNVFQELLKAFYENKFGDRMFPIEWVPDKTVVAIHSMKENEKVVRFCKKVDVVLVRDMCTGWQWPFFVPVFTPESSPHIISPDFEPFITEIQNDSSETRHSTVRHCVMERSHLEFPEDTSTSKQIVSNGAGQRLNRAAYIKTLFRNRATWLTTRETRTSQSNNWQCGVILMIGLKTRQTCSDGSRLHLITI